MPGWIAIENRIAHRFWSWVGGSGLAVLVGSGISVLDGAIAIVGVFLGPGAGGRVSSYVATAIGAEAGLVPLTVMVATDAVGVTGIGRGVAVVIDEGAIGSRERGVGSVEQLISTDMMNIWTIRNRRRASG